LGEACVENPESLIVGKNNYKISVEKTEYKRPPETPMCRLEDVVMVEVFQ
jgi:hypothetical protein